MARYADALDGRDWPLLDGVFAADISADYGTGHCVVGREALVAFIRGFLDPCGPTQHLMGGTRAIGPRRTRTPVRAFHLGRDGVSTYEAIGTYRVDWREEGGVFLADTWRLDVIAHLGDMAVLGRTSNA